MSEDRLVELELKGSREQVLGFVEGFRLASGVQQVWFCPREHIYHGGFVESLKEAVHLETHVILPVALAEAVVGALEESPLVDIEVGEVNEIESAELPFEFKCFSREDAGPIQALIEKDLPDGVSLEDYEVDEEIHDDAVGVEMYSPVHDYILSGAGRYVGQVPGVLEMAHRLDDRDFVHPEKVRLHFAS
ncbi:MAG: hypothetical protein ACC742_13325 [Thermoanaerobaculales bacterium]